MYTPVNSTEKNIHRLFEISIILKGVHALIEIVGAFAVLFISQSFLQRTVIFLTQEELSELKLAKGTMAVYVPLSYSFSGNLLIVPSDHITLVDASSAEVMKFIVSGGVTDIDE